MRCLFVPAIDVHVPAYLVVLQIRHAMTDNPATVRVDTSLGHRDALFADHLAVGLWVISREQMSSQNSRIAASPLQTRGLLGGLRLMPMNSASST